MAAVYKRCLWRLTQSRCQHSAAAMNKSINNNTTNSVPIAEISTSTSVASPSPAGSAAQDKKKPVTDQKIKLESPPADAAMIKYMLRHVWPKVI